MSDIKHFLDLSDFTGEELRSILRRSREIKEHQSAHVERLKGKTLIMIFQKPSTRTRVSFEVGMKQLGGETVVLSSAEMQLGRGETVEDTARVLSRYGDGIMIRTGEHSTLTKLAANASVPVINGLTDYSHPCQIMADVLTYEEHRGTVAGKTFAWSGDFNNVTTSFVHAAGLLGFKMRVACPEELYEADEELLIWAENHNNCLEVTHDPFEAVKGADCVITDCWVSMHQKDAEERKELLSPYQVNAELMREASSEAVFLHCLPAHRGEEVTDEIMDGPASLVFDEAENRLHAQKAILEWCLG